MFQLILEVIFKLTDWKVETERFGLCSVTQSFWFGFTSLSVPLCLTKTQYQYITDLLVTIYAPKSPSFQFKFLGETDRFSVGHYPRCNHPGANYSRRLSLETIVLE